eukprot:Hpha_TRINITY_DN9619_c0_g1::TRINITY_DN9619_c0_g1_i1::g.184522::m.184522
MMAGAMRSLLALAGLCVVSSGAAKATSSPVRATANALFICMVGEGEAGSKEEFIVKPAADSGMSVVGVWVAPEFPSNGTAKGVFERVLVEGGKEEHMTRCSKALEEAEEKQGRPFKLALWLRGAARILAPLHLGHPERHTAFIPTCFPRRGGFPLLLVRGGDAKQAFAKIGANTDVLRMLGGVPLLDFPMPIAVAAGKDGTNACFLTQDVVDIGGNPYQCLPNGTAAVVKRGLCPSDNYHGQWLKWTRAQKREAGSPPPLEVNKTTAVRARAQQEEAQDLKDVEIIRRRARQAEGRTLPLPAFAVGAAAVSAFIFYVVKKTARGGPSSAEPKPKSPLIGPAPSSRPRGGAGGTAAAGRVVADVASKLGQQPAT